MDQIDQINPGGPNRPANKGKFSKGPKTPKPELLKKIFRKRLKILLLVYRTKVENLKELKIVETKRENVAQKRMEEEAFAELDEKNIKINRVC